MATSSREARRRKIIERGSDRLAFITGQIRSIPDPPPSDSTSPSESVLRSHEPYSDSSPPADGISASTSQVGNISDVMLNDNEIGHADRDLYQSKAEPLRTQMSTNTSASTPASEPQDTVQPPPTASTTKSTVVADLSARQALYPLGHFTNIITPIHIGAAIDASEYTRMFSSLVIALLVVLAHLGFSSVGNVISIRPVFLLLLSDATIVLGCILLSHHRQNSSTASRREFVGQGIADQVGNALEMALMMKKILNGVLMDFSVYAVVLICGLLFSP